MSDKRLTSDEVIIACRDLSKEIKRINREFRRIRLVQEDIHLRNLARRIHPEEIDDNLITIKQ